MPLIQAYVRQAAGPYNNTADRLSASNAERQLVPCG